MQLSLVFSVCIVAGLVGLLTAQCDRNAEINGCSIPYGLPAPYKQRFTPSCNRHDVCYGCGDAKGITRLDCDNAFLRDMKTSCASIALSDERRRCLSWANGYYAAVRVVGGSRYVEGSRFWCSQSWVSGCLP